MRITKHLFPRASNLAAIWLWFWFGFGYAFPTRVVELYSGGTL